MTVTVRLNAGSEPLFEGAAGLFDEYRQHFGANPAPDTVAAWLLEQVFAERSRIYVAGRGETAYGICSVAVVPAALTLRTVWLVRDLYVAPAARRQGIARALLTQVGTEARAAGAHRLSLQTDTANLRAIELYAKNGFEVLTDVAAMDLLL
jgi:GNAT superfamily N-acetyltransferase